MRDGNKTPQQSKKEKEEFTRQAVRVATRKQEFAQIREGYRQQPDSASEADDWSTAEEFAQV